MRRGGGCTWWVVVAVAVVLAACGDGVGAPATTHDASTTAELSPGNSTIPPDQVWDVSVLDIEWPVDVYPVEDTFLKWPPPQIHRMLPVASGRIVGVGLANERFTVWDSEDGLTWRLVFHEPHTREGVQQGSELLYLHTHALTRLGDRLVVVGSALASPSAAEPNEEVAPLWVSDDEGATWERVSAEGGLGPERPTVTAMTEWASGLVALGHITPAGAESWHRESVIWLSDDAVTWTRVDDPFGSSSVHAVYPVDGALVAFGADDAGFAVWHSDDGRQWQKGDPGIGRGIVPAGFVATLLPDGRVVFVAAWSDPGRPFVWVTADGSVFEVVDVEIRPLGMGSRGATHSVGVWSGHLLVLGVLHDRPGPNHCYVDLAGCDEIAPVLAISGDLTHWRRVVLPDSGLGPVGFEAVHVVGDSVVLTGTALVDGEWVQVGARYIGAEPLPPSQAITMHREPDLGTPLLGRDERTLEVGAVWRLPVVIAGCGLGLEFNGRHWLPADPIPSLSLIPPEWPVRREGPPQHESWVLYGTITLAAEDLIEVADHETAEVLITFVPTDESPVLCF